MYPLAFDSWICYNPPMPSLELKPTHKPIQNYYYFVRLLGQVITVSLETVKVVKGLSALGKLDVP